MYRNATKLNRANCQFSYCFLKKPFIHPISREHVDQALKYHYLCTSVYSLVVMSTAKDASDPEKAKLLDGTSKSSNPEQDEVKKSL